MPFDRERSLARWRDFPEPLTEVEIEHSVQLDEIYWILDDLDNIVGAIPGKNLYVPLEKLRELHLLLLTTSS